MKLYNYSNNGENVNIKEYKHNYFSNILYMIPLFFFYLWYITETFYYVIFSLLSVVLLRAISYLFSKKTMINHYMFTGVVLDNEKKELYKIGIFPEKKSVIPGEIDFKNDKYNKYLNSLKQVHMGMQDNIGFCLENLSNLDFFKHILRDKPSNDNYHVLKVKKIYKIIENDDNHIIIIADVYNELTKNMFMKAPICFHKMYDNFNEIEEFINENATNENLGDYYYSESDEKAYFSNKETFYKFWPIIRLLIFIFITIIFVNVIIKH